MLLHESVPTVALSGPRIHFASSECDTCEVVHLVPLYNSCLEMQGVPGGEYGFGPRPVLSIVRLGSVTTDEKSPEPFL